MIGSAMTEAWSAALMPERNQPRPSSCCRTASAEKASSPSVPQPNVWAKKMTKEIGHEQNGAKPEPALPREPQPEAEGKEGQRHRQGEIDEAERNGWL